MKTRKISKLDLQLIHDMAKDNFINFDKKDLNNSQFMAKCYLEASAFILGLGKREYEERTIVEPVED